MPFIKLQFKPGVNRDQTDYSNEGGGVDVGNLAGGVGARDQISFAYT